MSGIPDPDPHASAQQRMPPLPEFLTLRDCAIELRMFRVPAKVGGALDVPDVGKLISMARRGKFPSVLIVSSRHALVKRREYEQWKGRALDDATGCARRDQEGGPRRARQDEPPRDRKGRRMSDGRASAAGEVRAALF